MNMIFTIEYVEQPNCYGGCHWVVRNDKGEIHSKWYDKAKAESTAQRLNALLAA